MRYFSENKNRVIKILRNKRFLLFFSLFFIFFFVGVEPANAQSTIEGVVGFIFALIFGFINSIIGAILLMFLSLLVMVASYGNIINVLAVEQGWMMVRDLCNMFFVLVLLVIAFATILRVESYNYKKLLPKLFIMAVLINFSKTICGLIIDFSQVIMLTFVDSFAQYGANNFVSSLGIVDYTKAAASKVSLNDANTSMGGIAGIIFGTIAGTIALIVSLITILAMTAVLVVRIVMLWLYVILSPLAFFASTFPKGESYSNKWWEGFAQNVVVGPVLAFFIWLALTTGTQSAGKLRENPAKGLNKGMEAAQTQLLGIPQSVADPTNFCPTGAAKIFCNDELQTYVIVIGLLLGGLYMAQQVGGAAGSIAGSAAGKIKGMASGALNKAKEGAWWATKGSVGWAADKASQKTGFDFNLADRWEGVKSQFAQNKVERKTDKYKAINKQAATGGIMPALNYALPGAGAVSAKPWEVARNAFKIRDTGKISDRVSKLQEDGNKLIKNGYSDSEETKNKLSKLDEEKASRMGEFNRDLKVMESGRESVKNNPQELAMLEEAIVKRKKEKDDYNEEYEKKEKELSPLRGIDREIKNLTGELYEKKVGRPVYGDDGKPKVEKAEDIVAKIDNADELQGILASAIKTGNKDMMSASFLKLGKLGEASSAVKDLGYNTDINGLRDFMNDLEGAGLSNDKVGSLVAEVGRLSAKEGDLGMNGVVKRVGNIWRNTTDDEHKEIQKKKIDDMTGQTIMRSDPKAFSQTVNGKVEISPAAIEALGNNIKSVIKSITEGKASPKMVSFLKENLDKLGTDQISRDKLAEAIKGFRAPTVS